MSHPQGMPNYPSSPTLDRIRGAGVLRVGTTGDYAPFSLRRPDGTYEGADVEMARDLAERLGVAVAFVSTVWADLLDHLLADRFDIAMGGVTVTVPRAEKAFFSIPTLVEDAEYAVEAAVLGEADVVRLQRRLDELEKRLHTLEARPATRVYRKVSRTTRRVFRLSDR